MGCAEPCDWEIIVLPKNEKMRKPRKSEVREIDIEKTEFLKIQNSNISSLKRNSFFMTLFYSSLSCVLGWNDTCLPTHTDEFWSDCLDNYPVLLGYKSITQKKSNV